MIEDKAIGLKIAENPEEAYWTQTKNKCETSIDLMKKEIELNEVILKYASEKLELMNKEAAAPVTP